MANEKEKDEEWAKEQGGRALILGAEDRAWLGPPLYLTPGITVMDFRIEENKWMLAPWALEEAKKKWGDCRVQIDVCANGEVDLTISTPSPEAGAFGRVAGGTTVYAGWASTLTGALLALLEHVQPDESATSDSDPQA